MSNKVTLQKLWAMKQEKEPIVSVTAYDILSAQLADEAGVELILVGDSLGNVILGYDTTLPVTLAEMLYHTRAARRGVQNGLLITDLPFGSYQASTTQAVESAVQCMKAGAEGVKLEGGYFEAIQAIVKAGIPVMGHVGMTPQSVHAFGGFKVQGKGEDALQIIETAQELEKAGVFAIVLELIPSQLAKKITEKLKIPTIGIGAGPFCDGQVQVFHDILGLNKQVFKHAKSYISGRKQLLQGLNAYKEEVRLRHFPTQENSF